MSSSSLSIPQCRMDRSTRVLDLHGCTKLQAIKRLTFFLDQLRHKHKTPRTLRAQNQIPTVPGPMAVTIVTGSGKHSTHGPVLRQAVEKTLQRRQMVFQLNPGNGSFCVDALSGIELVARDNSLKEDTKVIVTDSSNGNEVQLVNRNTTTSIAAVQLNSLIRSNTLGSSSSSDDNIVNDVPLPTPGEVARDDEQVEIVKQLSQSEAAKEKALKVREQNELKRACEDSVSLNDKMEEDEIALRKVLEMSRQQTVQVDEDEEEMLRQVLEMSEQVELEKKEEERLEFEAVLALSQQESNKEMEGDTDLLLMKILEQSKIEHMEFDTQLKLALEESVRTTW